MQNKVKEFVEFYKEKCSNGIFENCEVTVTSNVKKAKMGNASVSIKIVTDTEKTLECTLYISSKRDGVYVLFVNDNTKDVVFNNFGPDSIEKAKIYTGVYLERCTTRMKGIAIDEDDKPKRDSGYKGKQKKSAKS